MSTPDEPKPNWKVRISESKWLYDEKNTTLMPESDNGSISREWKLALSKRRRLWEESITLAHSDRVDVVFAIIDQWNFDHILQAASFVSNHRSCTFSRQLQLVNLRMLA